MPQVDYRSRIYDYYVHARNVSLAPPTVAAMQDRAPYLTRMIARHFPPDRDARILDLGAGHGTLVYFARQAGYRNTVGVDRSPEQIAEATRLGIEGMEQGDLMVTLAALPQASQDVVITFDVIEHFTRDELLALADEILRVLKPGGRWIIHTPNAESPFFGRIRYGDFTHEQAFTYTSMGQFLLSSGFRSLESFEDEPVAHGLKSSVRLLLWKLIRATLRFYLTVETGSGASAILTQNFLTVAVK